MVKKHFFIVSISVSILTAVVLGVYFQLNSLNTSNDDIANSKASSPQQSLLIKKPVIVNNNEHNKVINWRLASLLSLQLNIQLRWAFDEIIQKHLDTQQPINDLLNELIKKLKLSTLEKGYFLDLFSRYQAYKVSLIDIKKAGPDISQQIDLEETLSFINLAHERQLDYFNQPEIDAFFAQDNKYDKQALARLAIQQDESLSVEAKKALILHQISQMDEKDRDVYLPSLEAANIADYIAGKSQIIPINSIEINERIEKVKQSENYWKARVNSYKVFFANNQQNALSIPEKQLALKAYAQENFSKNELKRLQVFIQNPSLLGVADQ
ncbi:MAG: lipase chaperone [Alteromonadaceae bacterium]|nr:lipase chaperone [Alteromonadaceae bacterium]